MKKELPINFSKYTPAAAGDSWRVVIHTADFPKIKYTATVMLNNIQVVYGWTAEGELYEFKAQ